MATTKVTTDVIDMSGNTGGLTWVKGTTAQKPSGVIGEIRENTETNRAEVYTNQVGTPPTTSTCDYPSGAGAQALYQFDTATLTTDTCGNYSGGTNNNVTQNTTVKKFGTSSAEFNGSTSDIDLEAGLDSTTMSVSFWIYIDATITTNGVVVELENGYGVWFIASAPGKLGMQSSNANSQHTLSDSQLASGGWHHVAAVWNSGSRTFYLDNVVQSGGTVADYLTMDENTLGSRRSGEFFDGYLDQVRFYNTALTASQVDNLFKESSTSTGNEWRNLKETSTTLTVNYLIVAGGGGGGTRRGGAGGAGGLRTSYGSASGGGASPETAFAATLGTAYTIQVGPGGAGGVDGTANVNGTNGTDSKFGTVGSEIISKGGGYGGSYAAGGNGGSGGGDGPYASPAGPGQGETGQGFDGGTSVSALLSFTGGGGGAGTAGNTGGIGEAGNGLTIDITGSSVCYAGGGGGASTGNVAGPYTYPGKAGGCTSGGAGGEANPTGGTAGVNGTQNTGGGGGGGAYNTQTAAGTDGGQGGSGIVILRTTKAAATLGSGITVNSTAGPGSVNGVSVGSEYYYEATLGSGTITFS